MYILSIISTNCFVHAFIINNFFMYILYIVYQPFICIFFLFFPIVQNNNIRLNCKLHILILVKIHFSPLTLVFFFSFQISNFHFFSIQSFIPLLLNMLPQVPKNDVILVKIKLVKLDDVI